MGRTKDKERTGKVRSCSLGCAVWETTLACNMNCTHCGSSAGKARPDELDTSEAIRLCEELAEVGCGTVALMGGEPLVRPDWAKIATCVRDLGMELSIVSNGLLVGKYIDRIAALGPKVVGISLDGLEKTHDGIRREGSYKAAMKAIKLLRDRDIQVTVITTVSRTNFNDLGRMKDIIRGTGVNWQVQVAKPLGNFDRKHLIDREDYYAVAMFIASQRIKHPFEDLPVIGAHCFGYHSKLLPDSGSWNGCTAGISSVGITSDGGVVGCLSMGNDRFLEGNVRERSFVDIWNDPNSFSYNRNFTLADLGDNCSGCSHGATCMGGCDSMSINLTGSLHNDPYCFLTIERDIIGVRKGIMERIREKFSRKDHQSS